MEGTNVVKLPRKGVTKAERSKRAGAHRKTRGAKRAGLAATGVGLVSLVLTALSLKHLAVGIAMVTHSEMVEASAMAVGIDFGFVALELAMLNANEKTVKAIKSWVSWTIAGTMIGSAAMNAFAFGHAAEGWMTIPAIAFGLAIPAMIYSMTRVGATMWVSR